MDFFPSAEEYISLIETNQPNKKPSIAIDGLPVIFFHLQPWKAANLLVLFQIYISTVFKMQILFSFFFPLYFIFYF